MRELLRNPGVHESGEEVRERVLDLAKRLRQVGTDSELVSLYERREACREAHALADERPDAARLLAPALVTVLRKELEREYGFVADQMIKRGLSRGIQTDAARTLARLAGSSLIQRYDEAGKSLAPLITVLTETLTTGETTAGQIASMEALAALSWIVPELVSDIDDIRTVATAVGFLVANTTDSDRPWRYQPGYQERPEIPEKVRKQSGLRLLTVLAIHAPEAVPVTDDVVAGIQTGFATNVFGLAIHDFRCQAYTALVAHSLNHTIDSPRPNWVKPNTTPQSTLETLIIESSPGLSFGQRRYEAAEALGAAVAAGIEYDVDVPKPIIEAISDSREPDRRFAVQALGAAVTAGVVYDTDVSQALIKAVSNSRDPEERRWATRALGAAVAANAKDDADVRRPLIEAVNKGREREHLVVAELLGEVVVADTEYDAGIPHSLIEAVNNSKESENLRMMALGEVVAAGAAHDIDVPQPLIEAVSNSRGLERQSAAKVLGEVVVASAEHDADISQPLTEAVVDRAGMKRRKATEALGAAVVAGVEYDADVPQALIKAVSNSRDPEERRWATRALGAAVAADAKDVADIPPPLIEAIINGKRIERQQATRALEAAVAAGVVYDDDFPQALFEAVNYGNGSRILALETLGEAAAAGVEYDVDVPKPIIEAVRYWRGVERREAARALGEVVAAGVACDVGVPQALIEAVSNSRDSEERREAARALETAVAVGVEYEVDIPLALIKAINDNEGMGWLRRRVAWALGEIVAAGGEYDADVSRTLIEAVTDNRGSERQQAARALGEVVATGSEYDALSTLARRVQNNIAMDRVEEFAIIATSGIDTRTFFQAITVDGTQYDPTAIDITPYLNFPEPERSVMLDVISTVIAQDIRSGRFSALRQQIQDFLTGTDEVPTATRLIAIDILSNLDEYAGNQ